MNLGYALIKQQRYAEADEELAAAVAALGRRAPEARATPADRHLLAKAWAARGEAQFRQQRFTDAADNDDVMEDGDAAA